MHAHVHAHAISQVAEQMIEDGLAYVDPSPQEEQQKGRFEKVNSKYRDTPPAESLRVCHCLRPAPSRIHAMRLLCRLPALHHHPHPHALT